MSYLRFYEKMNHGILYSIYKPSKAIFYFGGNRFMIIWGFKSYDNFFFFEINNEPLDSSLTNSTKFYPFAKIVPGNREIFVDIGNSFGFGNETLFTILSVINY